MKKLISIFAVITFATVEASAATCESLGLTVGAICDGSGGYNIGLDLCCANGGIDPTTGSSCRCAYRNCDGSCWCNVACETGGGIITPTCTSGQYSAIKNCKDCPEYSDENGAVFSAIESESPFFINNCFVPTTASISDASGTFSFTSNCNYSSF